MRRRIIFSPHIERAIDLEGIDHQVAVPSPRIFRRGVLKVIEEVSADAMRPLRYVPFDLVAAPRLKGVDIEYLHLAVIEPQFQPWRFLAGSLARCIDAQRVSPGSRKI